MVLAVLVSGSANGAAWASSGPFLVQFQRVGSVCGAAGVASCREGH